MVEREKERGWELKKRVREVEEERKEERWKREKAEKRLEEIEESLNLIIED